MYLIYYRANLVFETAFYTTNAENITSLDATITRTSDGRTVLTGTSIVGTIRQWINDWRKSLDIEDCQGKFIMEKQSTVCRCPECVLLGTYDDIPKDRLDLQPFPSSLTVYDAEENIIGIGSYRDGIRISPETGSADTLARAIFKYEIAPKGLILNFKCKLSTDTLDSTSKRLFETFLLFSSNVPISFGGKKSSGLGYAKFNQINIKTLNLSNKDDFGLEFSNKDKYSDLDVFDINKINYLKINKQMITSLSIMYQLTIRIKLHSTTFLGIQGTLEKIENDFSFFPKKENLDYVVPGSSLRGVIKSQIRKIAQLLGYTICSGINDDLCKKENPCIICQLFGSLFSGGKLAFTDGHINNINTELFYQDMIAIDRFTQAVSGGSKFNAVTLVKPTFSSDITIREPDKKDLELILLALRDIRDGYISVGYGSSKGYGCIELKDLEFEFLVSGNFKPEHIFSNENMEWIQETFADFIKYKQKIDSTKLEQIISKIRA